MGDPNWDSPWTPFVGNAGSSRGCGGRRATRIQAVEDGRGAQGSALDVPRSGAACGALHGTPSHLEPKEQETDLRGSQGFIGVTNLKVGKFFS